MTKRYGGLRPCHPSPAVGRRFAALVLFLGLFATPMPAAPDPTLRGTIIDRESGAPIGNALVQLDGHTSISDASGRFTFDRTTAGPHSLAITSIGHSPIETFITLIAGENTLPPIYLIADTVKMDRVVVLGRSTSAEDAFADRAMSATGQDVISGAALSNPSIQNASDALKGVAGVTVSRAADGATNVSIRGLAPQFNRVTVDGQRQSNPGRFSAGSALDSLPPEILKSIEVSKSLTPDMDADAIGGVVNLSTADASGLKQAFAESKGQLVFNSTTSRIGSRSNVSLGSPFKLWSGKNDAGFLLSFTFDDTYRQRENVETFDDWPLLLSPGPAPFAGTLVPAFTHVNLEDTLDHRERGSMLFNADTRVGNTSLFFKSNLTRDERLRTRSQEDFDAAKGTALSLSPDAGSFSGLDLELHGVKQDASREMATMSVGEKTDVDRIHTDASFGVTRTEDREPHTVDALFSSIDPYTISYDTSANRFLPTISFSDDKNPAGTAAAMIDPAGYGLTHLTVTQSDAVDTNYSGQADLKIDLNEKPQSPYLKFGAKAQRFQRSVTQARTVYDSSPGYPALTEAGLVRTPLVTFQNGAYQYGPAPNPEPVADLVTANPARFPIDAADTALGSAAGSAVNQTIWAAYGMGRIVWGRWSLLGGVRIEDTQFDAVANQPLFSGDGSLLGFQAAKAGRSYINVLPGLHLRFDPRPGLIFRASAYRSLVRPSYSDLAPYLDINFDQFRARAGNPGLKPYSATNADITADFYSGSAGLISSGVFLKSIRDFQADSERVVTIGNLGQFVEYQRINGDTATAGGLETSWKGNPWTLPGDLAAASVSLNYTFTRSESHLPGRPGEDIPLPLQAEHQFNLGLHLERGALSTDFTVTHHSKMLDEVVAYQRDRYETGAWDIDINASCKFSRSARLFAGVSNLTRAPIRAYSGDASRVKEFESQGLVLSTGFSWKF